MISLRLRSSINNTQVIIINSSGIYGITINSNISGWRRGKNTDY
ncbi:unnamed protein product [Schistosoma mattheei]|uniref:Uncharacterized protein n=1 Tax=Schistosoma mattheei TaxID=31246 RepID=A0A183PXL8_9TREM|nr:unnamed protein product [Schistosoma mattheei]